MTTLSELRETAQKASAPHGRYLQCPTCDALIGLEDLVRRDPATIVALCDVAEAARRFVPSRDHSTASMFVQRHQRQHRAPVGGCRWCDINAALARLNG